MESTKRNWMYSRASALSALQVKSTRIVSPSE